MILRQSRKTWPHSPKAGGGQGSQKKEDGKAQGSAVDDAAVGGGDRGTMVHGDLLLCIFMQGRCRTAKTGCIAYNYSIGAEGVQWKTEKVCFFIQEELCKNLLKNKIQN